MTIRRILLLSVFCIIFTTFGFSQVSLPNYSLRATILEEGTQKPLPFATVYNQRTERGTASNIDGIFELPKNQIGDTLLISYIGYQDREIVIGKVTPNQIYLQPRSAEIEEVVVRASDEYLYDMVAKLRKNRQTDQESAKTYFFLESKLLGKTIEIIEAFFQGSFTGYGIHDLQLKKGRIGTSPVQNRYYFSTETSRVFSMHDLFSSSNAFPRSPLELKKRKLRRYYTLTLKSVLTDDQSKIYLIQFNPKKDPENWFAGTLWINPKENFLRKIYLQIPKTKTHPFIPIGDIEINEVTMEMRKLYKTHRKQPFLRSMDFSYSVSYKDKKGSGFTSQTKAYLRAYDYKDEFVLPVFNFTPHWHEDYRNMTIVPYDSAFWAKTSEFRFYDRLEEVEQFVLENKIEDELVKPQKKEHKRYAQLEFPYLNWHKNRFKMKPPSYEVVEESRRNTPFEIDRYNFNANLYLDISLIEDSLHYQLKSILDPVNSYYHFPIQATDLAFMNMYFDLMEIHRRDMETEIGKLTNPKPEDLKQLHAMYTNAFETTAAKFIEEVNRGKNHPAMKAWNQLIYQSLQIDNLSIFQLGSN